MTHGVSVIPARERASHIRAKPPPDVVASPLAPAYHAPITMFRAAISSSACSTRTSNSFPFLARYIMTPVLGDMGYDAR